jgi:Zn-dependent alcohol dehydrogenase
VEGCIGPAAEEGFHVVAGGDPIEQVRALTDGRGADYSFEAVGLPRLLVQAFDMVRLEGTVTYIGMPAERDATLTLPTVSTIFTCKRNQGSGVGGSPDPPGLPPPHPAGGDQSVGPRRGGVPAYHARRGQ